MIYRTLQGKIASLHAYKNQAKLAICSPCQGLDLKLLRKFSLDEPFLEEAGASTG